MEKTIKASIDRSRGAMVGLAVGDAVGTALEFSIPGSFEPIDDMLGGGPFDLKPGQWTDDTSMALCLAESLIECGGFDPIDQLETYVRWHRDGHLSSTGKCFDIGGTVSCALSRYARTAEPYCGPTAEETAGNGSLMRLAPVPLFFANDPDKAIEVSGMSSRTTHQAPTTVDACRYFGGLIVGALRGCEKDELLSPQYAPAPGYWDDHNLVEPIKTVADGSFKTKMPPAIVGSGYVVKSMEAALWAFYHGTNFRDGLLMAVNLGSDADTTGAIYGQLAGAYYGLAGIPREWVDRIAMRDLILTMADKLFEFSNSI